MRLGNRLGAAFAATLTMTALPAAAQRDPASLFAPKPAPDSSAEMVPATPEAMGLTPQQFERMGYDAKTMLTNRPSRKSDGFTQYETPIAVPGPALRPVIVVPGAIVASAAVRIDERRWLLKEPIAVGAPFGFSVPAGSVFGSSIDENGESRPCLNHKPYQSFIPPKDGEGEIYPSLCIREPQGPGRYAAVRLYPYFTDRAKPRDLTIAPASLDPIPAGTSHPMFGAVLAVRRLRVTEVSGDVAVVALEMAWDKRLEDGGPRDPFVSLQNFGAKQRVQLPLAEGETASLGGITLTVHRAASGWTVTPSGGFDSWASVSPDGASVTLGDRVIGARPR
jgi:hypothetical protein